MTACFGNGSPWDDGFPSDPCPHPAKWHVIARRLPQELAERQPFTVREAVLTPRVTHEIDVCGIHVRWWRQMAARPPASPILVHSDGLPDDEVRALAPDERRGNA